MCYCLVKIEQSSPVIGDSHCARDPFLWRDINFNMFHCDDLTERVSQLIASVARSNEWKPGNNNEVVGSIYYKLHCFSSWKLDSFFLLFFLISKYTFKR